MLTDFPQTDWGVAQAILANNGTKGIQYRNGMEWVTWNVGQQRWKEKEEHVYLGWLGEQFRQTNGTTARWIAGRLEGTNSANSVLVKLAQMSEFKDAIWDRDPYLVGHGGGVVDLRTLIPRKQRQEDYISISTPVIYTPNAECPLFKKFLQEIQPNEEIREYLHRLLGTGLIAKTPDQLFHFWQGEGGNGKTVLSKTVEGVLGGLCRTVHSSLFMRNADAGTVRFALGDISYRRLLLASEVPIEGKLAEYRVKQLTGEDSIIVEQKNKPQGQITVFATCIMLINEMPKIEDNSVAIRRRLRVVPFTEQFNDTPDSNLIEKLSKEKEGILNWLVQGANEFYKNGLGYPTVIREFTEEVIRKNFSHFHFFEETIEYCQDERVSYQDLVSAYRKWCKERGIPAKGDDNKVFGEAVMKYMGKNLKKIGDPIVSYRDYRFKDKELSIAPPGGY